MVSVRILAGVAITAVALVGGGVATYLNIRNSRGPKEKAFVTRACTVAWAVILSMLAAVYLLPPPWRYIAAGGYFIVCPILVYKWATTHQLIRVLEERENDGAANGKPVSHSPAAR
jgi:hypothetical protein